MKRALITGITGQDGAYLSKFLLDKGYEIYGTYRRISTPNFWRLQYMDIFDKIHLIPMELIDSGSITEALTVSKPDEVYHLAAQSFVGASFEQPIGTGEITGLGVTRMLEAMRHVTPGARFYQASTSELYGNSGNTKPFNEKSPFEPASPYAAAKLYGYWTARMYREGYGLFACNGILFNHESPLRGLEFVTRKITNAAAKIALGLQEELLLGNLEAKRDWGYAGDYVESMWMMMQHKSPGDYVIATNTAHSVREFAEKAFGLLGLDYQDHVKTDKRFQRPLDVHFLRGDYSNAEWDFGWVPKTDFNSLVKMMVEADMTRWQMWQDGKVFPWDAINYPGEDKILSRYQRMDR